MEEWPYMSMRNWTISIEVTLESLKRIYLKPYGWSHQTKKAKILSEHCCACRPPDMDVDEFKDPLEKVFQKFSKENKSIYLMGDFKSHFL